MHSPFTATLLILAAISPAVTSQPTCARADYDVRTGSHGTWEIYMPFASGNSIACQLKSGDDNEAVRVLQEQMNTCYGTGLTTDGDYGSKTAAAVKYVQGQSGASQDGEYGAETRGKMLWYAVGADFCEKLTYWGS